MFHLVREPYETANRSQEYYGVIDFFYYFSWYNDILRIVKRKGGGHTLQASECCAQFLEMKPAEKYLLMLTVWFYQYRHDAAESIFESSHFTESIMQASEGGPILYSHNSDGRQP